MRFVFPTTFPSASRRVPSLFAAVLACAVAIGFLACGMVRAADGPDLSTPKSAATAFAKAVEAGDVDAMKKTATGTDAEFTVVKGVSDMYGAMKRYETAAIKKFGDKGKLPFPTSLADEVAKNDEKIEGDKATIVSKAHPDEKHPMTLKKDGAAWKVDLSSMDPEMAQAGKNGKAAADAIDAISKDLDGDRYKSADESLAALGQAIEAAMKPAAPAAK